MELYKTVTIISTTTDSNNNDNLNIYTAFKFRVSVLLRDMNTSSTTFFNFYEYFGSKALDIFLKVTCKILGKKQNRTFRGDPEGTITFLTELTHTPPPERTGQSPTAGVDWLTLFFIWTATNEEIRTNTSSFTSSHPALWQQSCM